VTEDGDSAQDTPPDANDGDEFPAEPIATPPDTDGEDEGKQFTAVVDEIETVSASAVPTAYPVQIETADAIAVRLTVRGTDKPVFVCYFESPHRGPDDRLARLLAVADGTDPEALVGAELLLTITDGYYVPVVPEGQPRGSKLAVIGVFLGLLPSILIGLVSIFAPNSGVLDTSAFVSIWLAATFLVLPISLYVDALNLQSTTNWTGRPRKWAAMAAVPGLNVLAVPLYLIARENADRLASLSPR
jgi:hypothetical protein